MTMLTDWNYVNVSDFEYLNSPMKQIKAITNDKERDELIWFYGNEIIKQSEMSLLKTPI